MPRKTTATTEGMDAILEKHGIAIEAQSKVRKPFFPLKYVQVQDDGVLPPNKFIVVLTGEHESGKSTAAAGADPVRPGEDPTTFYLDLEDSVSTLRTQYPLAVYDHLAADAEGFRKIEDDPKNGMAFVERLFMAYLALIERIKAGEEPLAVGKRTLVIDPLDKLFEGSNLWTRKNPTLFGKYPGQFGGEKGTRFSFAATIEWWNDHLIKLTEIFDLIVIVSHIGDKWEEEKKVGLKIKGPNLSRCSSLTIWMHTPSMNVKEPGIPQNTRWAELKKDRFSWVYWPTLDDLRVDGVLDRLVAEGVLQADELDDLDPDDDRIWSYMCEQPRSVLPRKFPVPVGTTVFNIIRAYMRKPQRNFGDLDSVLNPGDENALSDDERLQIKADMAKAEAEAETARNERAFVVAKTDLMNRLRTIGYTRETIQTAMKELNLTLTSLSDIETVYDALEAHKGA